MLQRYGINAAEVWHQCCGGKVRFLTDNIPHQPSCFVLFGLLVGLWQLEEERYRFRTQETLRKTTVMQTNDI